MCRTNRTGGRLFLLTLAIAGAGWACSSGQRPTVEPKRAAGGEQKPAAKKAWITFLSHRTGDNLLYHMRPDGSDCKPIFGGPVKDAPGLREGMTVYLEPHWTWQSPDGKYFASWAWESLRPPGKSTVSPRFRLHLGRTDGPGPARLLSPTCMEAAAWSPESKRLAYAVLNDKESSGHLIPARMTRIYVVAIDATAEDKIFELPGSWTPQDWSPDGKRLLLTHGEIVNAKLLRNELVELDMEHVKKVLNHPRRNDLEARRWQNWDTAELLEPVLGQAAPVAPTLARYSPDGKYIALTAIRRAEKPREWKALDFELGVIDREKATYRKVIWYKDGLRGPICWSPDGSEILFSRPLKAGDKREAMGPADGAINQEHGLGLWAIKPDGSGERFLTTGWSPDWR
jgi:hypothetical protein